jgi:tripartite-type tricarboxylate transporter receptor subunit TctC
MNRIRIPFLAVLVAALMATSAWGQAYPAKPVRIVVPFSVGTAADIVARQMGTRLSELWGQAVVIENVQGAGGNVGAALVAKAAPDGYTLLMAGLNLAINPSLYKDMPYELTRDFRPVARVASGPLIFVANPGFPANTVAELVTAAKARPGSINYGSGGNGSITHLAFELLKTKSAIDMTHVPYRGIAQMLTDIMGNQISLGAPAVASVVGNVKAGKLKALAVTTAKRASVLPDVPTVAESGVPGYDVSTWNGVLAPAGTRDDIVAKIHADVVRVARSKEFIDALQPQGLEPDLMNPMEFRSFLASELAKWSQLVKDSGAKLD